MIDNEIDFDDDALEAPMSVDELMDPVKPAEPAPEPIPTPTPEPKVKKATKVKADEPAPGTPTKPTTTVAVEEPEEEETGLPETEDGETFIQTMAKKIGIEIPEGVEFSDDEDGLIEFNDYVSDIKADNKLNSYFEDLPPVAGEFFDFLDLIKDDPDREDKIKEFFTSVKPEVDFDAIDLKNTDTQKAIMRTMYKKQGYTDADIKEELDDMEVAGTLERQAAKASKVLAAAQKQERSEILAREKADNAARQANTQRFFNSVKQVIDSGKVNNFNIPSTEKKALYDYDASGQFMKDINDMLKDPTSRVQLALAAKNKWNLGKYVEAAAATKVAQSLRDKVKSSNGKPKNGSSYANQASTNVDWDEAFDSAQTKLK